MPPPRRRPATPPTRRPKVAGLNKPVAPDEPEADEVVTELDVPVIGESNGRHPEPKQRDSGTVTDEPAPPRSPRRKRRQDPEPPTEVVEPDEPTDSEDAPEPSDTPDLADLTAEVKAQTTTEKRAPAKFLLPTILVVVALLLGGLAWFFAVKASDAKVGEGNAALVDVNGTKDLVGAAQQAVTGVLSYKWDSMDKATAQAKQYLAGEAVDQYDKSMQALAPQIQSQKLQVTVNPVSVGVVKLEGDDARVLVFADQIGVRTDNQPSGGPTQFAMDMHKTDGKWKVVKLDFFDGK